MSVIPSVQHIDAFLESTNVRDAWCDAMKLR